MQNVFLSRTVQHKLCTVNECVEKLNATATNFSLCLNEQALTVLHIGLEAYLGPCHACHEFQLKARILLSQQRCDFNFLIAICVRMAALKFQNLKKFDVHSGASLSQKC